MKVTKQGVRDLGNNFGTKRREAAVCSHHFCLTETRKGFVVGDFGEIMPGIEYGKKCGWCGEVRWDNE